MENIAKAHWVSNGNSVRLAMPLTKVDQEKRLVSGFASLDNPDSQDDIVLAEASVKAFSRFRGNIREMHQPIAVGKMVDFREDEYYDPKEGKFYKGVYVTVYVSKGAQDTWEKVVDGTLTGFSIGGNVLDADSEFDKAAGRAVRFIKDYELIELSLVDNPANQMANIFSVEKMSDGTEVMKGILVDTKSEIAFYCPTDELAKTSTESSLDCPNCGDAMVNAGWFEYNTDTDRAEKMHGAVQKYLSSINETQATANNEGGVDVAEDTVEKSAVPSEEPIEVAEEGKAETEVDASVESEKTDLTDEAEVTEAEAETEAADEDVSEVDNAEDDLAKMFDSLEEKITDNLLKNREAIDNALAEVNVKVEKFSEELDKKYSELATKHGELSEKFASIKDELGKMEKSISSLQDASAVKKSGDLGGEPETVVEKAATSTWGGHFLGVKSLND
jgi:hypothetical protein